MPVDFLPEGIYADGLNQEHHLDMLREVAQTVLRKDCPVVHLLGEVCISRLPWRARSKTSMHNLVRQALKSKLDVLFLNKMGKHVYHGKFAAASFRVFKGKPFRDAVKT